MLKKLYLSLLLSVSVLGGEQLVVGRPHSALAADPQVLWHEVASDLEIAEVHPIESILPAPIALVRSGLRQFRLAVVRAAEFGLQRTEVRTLCRLAKASVCINANFFDEAGDPLGVVVSRGIVHQRLHKGGGTLTGVLQLTRQGTSVVARSNYSGSAVLEAIQAGPRLLINGQPSEGIRAATRTSRSAVCVDIKGRVVFAATPPGMRGISLGELQRTLAIPEIGCRDALNLDGGGSTQLFVAPISPESSAPLAFNGFDTIPVALALVKQQEP